MYPLTKYKLDQRGLLPTLFLQILPVNILDGHNYNACFEIYIIDL